MENKKVYTNILYLTKNCNLRCDYCYQGKEKEKDKMSKDEVKRIIDQIRMQENNECRFLFFGGEVMINYDVLIYGLEYIKTLNSNGAKITACLTTNATLLDNNKMSQLFKYNNFLSIEVSIDGTKENHDRNRHFINGQGTHDIVMKKTKMLLQYFPFLVARVGIEFPNTIVDNIKYLHDNGFRRFCIQAINGPNYNYTEEDLNVFEGQIEQIKKILEDDPFAKIQTINYPKINNNRESIKGDKKVYHYFAPNGLDIIQQSGSYDSFIHFNKDMEGD